MHAQKRKIRIRNRVDQVSHEGFFFGFYFEIFPSEREYLYIRWLAGQSCDFIGIQTGAVDKYAGPKRLVLRLYNYLVFFCQNGGDFLIRQYASAVCRDQFCVFQRHRAIIDDTGLGNKYRFAYAYVRLYAPGLFRTDFSYAFETVFNAAPVYFIQLSAFAFFGSDDDLAAHLERNAMLPAEFE